MNNQKKLVKKSISFFLALNIWLSSFIALAPSGLVSAQATPVSHQKLQELSQSLDQKIQGESAGSHPLDIYHLLDQKVFNLIGNEVTEAKAKAKEKKAPTRKLKKDDKSTKDAVSNDVTPEPASDYEVVNQAPKKKKKGWWSKD